MRIYKLIKLAALLIGIAVVGFSVADVLASPQTQAVPPVSDPYYLAMEEYSDSSLTVVHYLFDDSGTITYERQNSTGLVLENRPATVEEIGVYEDSKDNSQVQTAKSDLIAAVLGENVFTWVDNRSVELQACESDMSQGQSLDFNSLGVNTQNDVIRRMQECIEVNARVNDVTIRKLEQLFVAGGWLEPEE